jgi:hypothetical protein
MGLSTGFLDQVRYFPFLAADGTVLSSLAAGTAGYPLFQFSELAKKRRVARLRAWRATAQAGVGLTLTADSYGSPLIDTAALGLVPAPSALTGSVWDVRALNQLSGTVSNTTPNAVSPWWAAWAVEFDAVPLAEQAAHAEVYGSLTPDQARLVQEQAQDPVAAATEPHDLTWIIRNEYVPHIREAVILGQTLTVTPGNPALFVQEARQDAQEMLVLVGLTMSPGSGTDGLTLIIGRDDQDVFYETPAYPLGQAGFLPWFVQAPRLLKIQATATTTVSAVSVAAWIWHVRLTDAIRYRLDQGVPTPVAQAIEVGAL